MIDEESSIPLYLQLKDLFVEKIDSGEWQENAKIPDELTLASQYRLSRSTVRQALLKLVDEGRLTRKQGKGTFVNEKKIQTPVFSFYYPEKFGRKHTVLSAQEIACSATVQSALQLFPGELVYELIRLRYFEDEVVAVETSYLPSAAVPGLLQKNLEGTLYELLITQYNLQIQAYDTTVEPVILTQLETERLQVEGNGQPALKITKIGSTWNKKRLILTKSIFRGDRCKLMFHHE